jgi:Dyp-type peroxidase family
MTDPDRDRRYRFGHGHTLESAGSEALADGYPEEPVLDLDEIQGNILGGFNKPHQIFLFLKIDDVASTREWLSEITKKVATLGEVLAFNRLFKEVTGRRHVRDGTVRSSWLNLALTFDGLKQMLGDNARALSGDAFKEGMWRRASALGVPRDQAVPYGWMIGDPGSMPDMMVLLADDVQDDLRRSAAELVRDLPRGIRLMRMEEGEAIPGGREHFGFRDGVSQPEVRGRLSAQPGDFLTPRAAPDGIPRPDEVDDARLVWPGEFVFGYPRHDAASRGSRGSVATGGATWARNGSFLVYQRLVQDVTLFHEVMRQAIDELRRKNTVFADWTPERLGAKLIGRWPSGAPLARSPEVDATESSRENDFGYIGEPELARSKHLRPSHPLPNLGLRCPLSAHIRKANPRDDVRIGGYDVSMGHRIIRRGITFTYPNGERGLHFIGYQTSIEKQFEFVMREWMNGPNFPEPDAGVDPIVGHGTKIFPLRILQENGSVAEVALEIPAGLVATTGGGYFFVPSISALKHMASDGEPLAS